MTRRRSDKPRLVRVERPEPLGVTQAPAVAFQPDRPPLLGYADHYDASAYPWVPTADDHRALKREEAFRARELADLPDDGEIDGYE